MNFRSLILLLLAAAATVSADAAVITSSFGDISATDNDNQAGPIRGVSYKILATGTYTNPSATQGNSVSANIYTATHALSTTDPTATGVEFQNLTWQRSSSTAMTGTFYVAIFDGLTVDVSGNVTALGTLKGVSTNSITTPAANSTMSWTFNNVPLTVGSTYQFVFSTTATPTVASDITAGQFELKTGTNLLSETTLVGGNASSVTNRAGWEPVFSMTYTSVPEPAAALLGGIGLICLLRRRR